jgi:outer membrane receptor protein involved in Fe transport
VGQAEGSTPIHSAQLRSQLVLLRDLSWYTSAYFSGRLTDPIEPSYTRLDTGLSWHFGERSSVGLGGQNLLKDRHMEFVDSTASAQTTFVKRRVFAQFTVRF